jgi:hypothetical protein
MKTTMSAATLAENATSFRHSIVQKLEVEREFWLASTERMETANIFARENAGKTFCITYNGMELTTAYYKVVVLSKAIRDLKRLGNEVADVIRNLSDESSLKPLFDTLGLAYPGSSNGWLSEAIDTVRGSIGAALYRTLDD